MLKVLGMVFILIASTGIGFSRSHEMQEHLSQLEELHRLFQFIRSELQYTRAPFAEIFEKISGKVNPPFVMWLSEMTKRLQNRGTGSFWDIWNEAIEKELKDSKLKNDELVDLQNIGKNLEYMESFDLYIEQLEYRIEQTREECKTKKKLCQSMGIMGGIFLVILLL